MNNFEKNKINPWSFDTKKLRDELLNEIVSKYWIDKETAEKLINKKTINKLSELKTEIQEQNYEQLKDFKEDRLEELFFTLKWAREVIEKASSWELDLLKKELEQIVNIEDFEKHIEAYLPKELIYKAKNPNNINEHLLWAALGTANSIIETTVILYQIWKGLIQTPYHVYLIASWKAEYPNLKRV